MTFDGGSYCYADVLTRKAESGISTVRSNTTRQILKFESVSAVLASCSVHDGNAFAN